MMKKILLSLLVCLPLMASAQTVLTPEQELEKAQRQLEEAKAALEQAKLKAQKAKAAAEAKAKAESDARAKAKAEEIQRKIAETKAEAERLKREAERIKQEADTQKYATEKETKKTEIADEKVNNAASSLPSAGIQTTGVEANNGWIEPTKVKTTTPPTSTSKANKAAEVDYVSFDAVQEQNGKVVWTETFSAPNLSAQELYERALAYLNQLTQEEYQLPNSKVILVNPEKKSIIASVHEKLVFSSSILSFDHSKFNYILQADCSDGTASLTMSRLTYNYTVQDKTTNYTAENWISNRVAVNKKGTKLYPVSGKFRRATINRKNQIFNGFRQALERGNATVTN